MADFAAKYEIDDGYAGGARPQHFKIREGDYDLTPDMDDGALLDLLYAAVDEDMRQRIAFCNVNEAAFLKWAREQITAQQRDE